VTGRSCGEVTGEQDGGVHHYVAKASSHAREGNTFVEIVTTCVLQTP